MTSANLVVTGTVRAPIKWLDLLRRHPKLNPGRVTPTRAKMTKLLYLQLAWVNFSVNQRIRFRDDKEDYWEIGIDEGDCEDYAIAKLVELEDLGWPRGCLTLVFCLVPRVGRGMIPHLVLGIETDEGSFILDNLKNYPVLWIRLLYKWMSRERMGSSNRWDYLYPQKINEH